MGCVNSVGEKKTEKIGREGCGLKKILGGVLMPKHIPGYNTPGGYRILHVHAYTKVPA